MTTDIAALRSEAANIIGLLTADGHQSFALDKVADFFDDVFRLLEAERQQREAAEARVKELEGKQVPVVFDADIIRDANRYRFLRDEDSWGEDSDSWDVETRTGLISSENLMGGLSPEHFDDAIDARMAASDIPFLNPVTAPQKPVVLPGISELIDACDSTPAVRDVHVWDLAISEVKRLNPSLFSDKSAAGGVVKDGE